jgi:hypothetical protein
MKFIMEMLMEKGKLYLVATPIGNLGDITYRAVEILKAVDVIAAEDTRQTLKLLNYLDIKKSMFSYHRHNEDFKVEKIMEFLEDGKDVAIVTDAGTPGISDPGEVAVKEAIDRNIEIIPIPGACALVNALIASGLNTKEFSFFGFLPINNKNRKAKLDEIEREEKTVILYEAPHRILETLADLKNVLGDRFVVVAKELTKLHETFYRGNIDEVIDLIGGNPRGEFIIMIDGKIVDKKELFKDMTLEEHYKYYEDQGFDKKEIIKKIAKDLNVSKNEIYQKFI